MPTCNLTCLSVSRLSSAVRYLLVESVSILGSCQLHVIVYGKPQGTVRIDRLLEVI